MATPYISITVNGGDPNVSDETITYGSTVTLENTSQTNVDGYSWKIISKPSSSSAVLSNVSWNRDANGGILGDIKTTFTADAYGTFIIELTLNRWIKGRIGVAVPSPHLSMRIPATSERNEFENGWAGAMYDAIVSLEDGYASVASATGSGSVSGDLSGSLPSPSVVKIQGRSISSSAPTDGQGLIWDNGTSQWKPTTISLSGAASGDLSGTYPNPTVTRIQGRSISATAPAATQVLTWSGTEWAPAAAGTPSAHASTHQNGGADEISVSGLSGVLADSQNADKLQSYNIDSTAPTSGQVLTWDAGNAWWEPATPSTVSHTLGGAQHIADTFSALNSKVADANLIGTTTSAAGDISGTFPTLSVIKIRGNAVDSAAPTDGQVLTWDAGNAWWEPADTGTPSGTASGDLSGTYPSPTVDGLQGRSVVATAPSDGQVLTWDSGNSWWEPATPSGGGGSGDGYDLVFAEDTEFTETNTVPQTKKTFRIVLDSEHAPTSWRVVISLWTDSGSDTAQCTVNIGGDSVVLNTTASSESVVKASFDVSAASTDTLITGTISLSVAAGLDTAHLKYTDIYAVKA